MKLLNNIINSLNSLAGDKHILLKICGFSNMTFFVYVIYEYKNNMIREDFPVIPWRIQPSSNQKI